jgi:hypothetical protein
MNKVIVAALALLWLACGPALGQESNTQLLALIAANVPSGNPGVLTAASLRAVLQAMVNSTNVASTTCPTNTAISPYQPWANTTSSPTGIVLNVYDGSNCVPWAIMNTSSHQMTIAGSANQPVTNIIARFGSLDVHQRGGGAVGGPGVAVPASTTAYTADGCYLATGLTQASTVIANAGFATGSFRSAAIARNSGQSGTTQMTFGCPLDTDEISLTVGSFVTLSFSVKAEANWSPVSGTLTTNVLCGTGSPVKQVSGYAGQTTVATLSSSITPSGSTQRLQVTSSAVVPSNCTQMEVQWTWLPTGTAGTHDTIDLDDVQLEVVPNAQSVASPFAALPFGAQLRLAQRFYAKTFAYGTVPAQNIGVNTGELQSIAGKTTTGVQFLSWRYPQQMRVAPNLTLFNPANTNAQVRDETAGDTSGSTGANTTADTTSVTATGNGSTAVGNILGVHITADAGI